MLKALQQSVPGYYAILDHNYVSLTRADTRCVFVDLLARINTECFLTFTVDVFVNVLLWERVINIKQFRIVLW